MGMHFSVLAVPTSVADLSSKMGDLWPLMRIVSTQSAFPDQASIWRWEASVTQRVPAKAWSVDNRGTQACLLCQDGSWAVLMDPSYCLASEQTLAQISQLFGNCMSFVVETTAGFAELSCYESGSLRRSIRSCEGVLETAGLPLPQELGISSESFYMDEIEQLMAALGLSAPDQLPHCSSTIGLVLQDMTDYSHLLKSAESTSLATDNNRRAGSAKPWWRFW